MKKVLFVIPSMSGGGAERVVQILANFMSKSGMDVHILMLSSGEVFYPLVNVSVHRCSMLSASEMNAVVQEYGIDVVWDHYHWEFEHVIELSRLKDVTTAKVILTEHSSYFYPLYQYLNFNIKSALKMFSNREGIYSKFDLITSLTKYSSELFQVNVPNVALLPNPVSYSTNAVSELKRNAIISVSGFSKKAKRVDRLYQIMGEATKTNGTLTLDFLGDYKLDVAKELAARYQVPENAVNLCGKISNVSDYYVKASVFVLSSDIEGFPMVLLEAAMHGLPSVVYAYNGIEDLVVDGVTGFIIPSGNAELFAHKLNLLLGDYELRYKMGKAARQFVLDEFSEEIVCNKACALMEKVAAGEVIPRVDVSKGVAKVHNEYMFWLESIVASSSIISNLKRNVISFSKQGMVYKFALAIKSFLSR